MLQILQEWWYSKEYKLVTTFFGKFIKDPNLKCCQSARVYWCYYNAKLKKFKIHASLVTITGKLDSYPTREFFLEYIFHGDYDSIQHNKEQLDKIDKMSNDFLQKCEEYEANNCTRRD